MLFRSLTKGRVALVDADDRELVAGHKWYCMRARDNFYAVRKVRSAGGKQVTLRMHTALTGFAMVDHVDGNGLNNRRANLRPASTDENNRNVRKRAGRSSRFKGVSWYASSARWRAQLKVGGRNLHLGYHGDEKSAALAYDAAARLHFGEFAALNFPQQGEHGCLPDH